MDFLDQLDVHYVSDSAGLSVRRFTISAPTKDEAFTTADGAINDLVFADGWLYWTSQAGTVAEKSMSDGSTRVIATNQQSPTGLAVGASRTYWGVASGVMSGTK